MPILRSLGCYEDEMERRTVAWLFAALLLAGAIAALLYGVVRAQDDGKRKAEDCYELIQAGVHDCPD
jgi:hypothetical protein